MNILQHRTTRAYDWLSSAAQLFKKQFARFSLLFIGLMFLMSMNMLLPQELSLFLSLISIPFLQMILFNAAHGTSIRGRFEMSDLLKKLDTLPIWLNLFLASMFYVFVLYLIISSTMPDLRSLISGMALGSELPPVDLMDLALPFLPVTIFLYATVWVFPLISWEGLSPLQAYLISVKASLKNALPIGFLILLLFLLTFMVLFFIQNTILFITRDLLIYSMFLFVVLNTMSVFIYLCQYTCYMDIFYGEQETIQLDDSHIE